MTWLLSALTSRLAGPTAAGLAALLALALFWQTAQLSLARGEIEKADRRIEALGRDLTTCRGNVATLEAARTVQNAALRARSDEDARRLAEAGKRLSEAVQGREKAEARAARLLNTGPVGVDACARAMDAFKTVKEQAR